MDKKTLEDAVEEAGRLLQRVGIDDRFRAKIHRTSDPDWVAQYRSHSQFQNGGTIFWVSELHPDGDDELVISVLHEYGHVLAEYVRVRGWQHPDLTKAYKPFEGDEEAFAEGFARAVFWHDLDVKQRRLIKVYAQHLAASLAGEGWGRG